MNDPRVVIDLLHASSASSVPAKCDETSSNDAQAASGEVRKPMKNISRERMKQETTLLRVRVQELERELSQLLALKAVERCKRPTTVWRGLAKRNAMRREKAERERERLRASLVQQLQLAKSLEMTLWNRWTMYHEERVPSEGADTLYPVDDMEKLHDKFMEEIDEAFPLVDTVLADSAEFRNMVVDKSPRLSIVETDDGKLYVDLRENFFVPFPYERVCEATWRAITTEYRRQQRVIEEFCCNEEEFSSKFFQPTSPPGSANPMMSAIVMRKFTEEHRMVLVWRSIEWYNTPHTKRQYGDDTGWVIVEYSVDPLSGKPNDDGAVVRMCTRYLPASEEQTNLLRERARSDSIQTGRFGVEALHLEEAGLMKRILICTEEDIASITESVGNILLDESIGSSKSSLETTIDEKESLRSEES